MYQQTFHITFKSQRLEVILIDFEREITTDDAIHEMDLMGLRPVEFDEIYAFSSQQPQECDPPIISLVWTRSLFGPSGFPLPYNSDGEPEFLLLKNNKWSKKYRFLAVYK